MSGDHIIRMLTENAINSISEQDLETIKTHIKDCRTCARAYEATQLSSRLLKARVAEQITPPPFFQTRVMAAIRARQPEPALFVRLWRAAGLVVSSMVMVVLVLAILNFQLINSTSTTSTETITQSTSTDALLDDSALPLPDPDSTNTQLLTALYETEELPNGDKQQQK